MGLVTKNLIADFGGANQTAFLAFQTWAIANQGSDQLKLILDAGEDFTLTDFAGQRPFFGIKNLIVSGRGATLTAGSSGLGLAGVGIVQDDQHHALLATVSADATTVALLTLADHSKFAVNQWVMISGIDLQGFGFPPNPGFFEYVQITDKNTSTGVITFSKPLRFAYKSTWPNFYPGDGNHAYSGGPATLYSLPVEWNTIVDIQGLTITGNGQTGCQGRSVTLRDVTFTDVDGPFASENSLWRAINCDFSNSTMEPDKLVERMIMVDCLQARFNFQSSSIEDFALVRSTVSNDMIGTPKNLTVINSALSDLRPGASGYGGTNSIRCSGSTISGTMASTGVVDTGTVGTNAGVNKAYTMSGGVIAIPRLQNVTGAANNGLNLIRLTVTTTAAWTTGQTAQVFNVGGTTEANGTWVLTVIDGTHVDLQGSTFANTYTSGGQIGQGAVRWAVPGLNCMFQGESRCEKMFQIVDVTGDAHSTYIQTSLAAGFPTLPLSSGKLAIAVHPCPILAISNCDGGAAAVDFSQAPAEAPIYSYSKRTFDGNDFGASETNQSQMWGTLVSVSFNVTQAYTGTNGTQTIVPAELGVLPNGSSTTYNPTINVRTTGNRIITPAGVTGTKAGDANLALANAAQWFANVFTTQYNNDIIAECTGTPALSPIITVEMTTDQGVLADQGFVSRSFVCNFP